MTHRLPACLGGSPAFAKPLLLTRPRRPDPAVFDGVVASIFESRWFTNDGVNVRRLEAEIRRRLDVPRSAAFSNATVALQSCLRSLERDGEVITTPFTFPATAHAISWTGLSPVFCDIDADTYGLSVESARRLITDRTIAILPVHVFGNPCDVLGLDRLAAATGVRIIYDAAHAFGVRSHGRSIGSWGDLSVLSFHATKLFHTGEGGAVVGSDPELFRRLALLRNFGIVNEDEVSGIGTNGKMSEIHAALGLSLIDQVELEIGARRSLVCRYRSRLSEVPGITFQTITPEAELNYAYMTIEVDAVGFGLSRDQLYGALRAENIMARRYFWPLCSENAYYRSHPSASREALPNAHRVASRILCLPCYGDMSPDAVDAVVDAIIAIQSASPRVGAWVESAEDRAV